MVKMIRETDDSPEGQGQDPRYAGVLRAQHEACNAEYSGLNPGSGRSSREGNGNPLQYSFLENPMDRGASWAIVHGVTKSRT